jgi:hypothetical protein
VTVTLVEKGCSRDWRQRVIVAEVVDQLFGAHGVLRRQAAGIEHAAHVGIGCGVDVDREGRNRIGGDDVDRVGIDVLIIFAVDVAGHRLRHGLRVIASNNAADCGAGAAVLRHKRRWRRRSE